MIAEEKHLNELLDENKPGSINKTIKAFPDSSKLDASKTSGREHRALLKEIIIRIKNWVVAFTYSKIEIDEKLGEKADLVNGKVPIDQLPVSILEWEHFTAQTTIHTLKSSAVAFVTLNGRVQRYGIDYTIAGLSLILPVALSAGSVLGVLYATGEIEAPAPPVAHQVGVATYADMLAVATGPRFLEILVLADEDKGQEHTTYKYWPVGNGVIKWVAEVIEKKL